MSTGPMNPADPMSQAGARWCTEHSRWECAANLGRAHHGVAIRGMPYCRHHVGKTTALAKAQGEANLLAWSTAAAAEERPLDVGQVVMDQLRVAVLRADLYGELLRIQVEAAAGSEDLEVDGLVAPTYTIGREGQRYQTGEQVRGLAKLEAEWRDRAVRFAKTAHDMGIDERQVELEQAKATQVVSAVGVMLDAMDLTAEQRQVGVRTLLAALGRGEGSATTVTEDGEPA